APEHSDVLDERRTEHEGPEVGMDRDARRCSRAGCRGADRHVLHSAPDPGRHAACDWRRLDRRLPAPRQALGDRAGASVGFTPVAGKGAAHGAAHGAAPWAAPLPPDGTTNPLPATTPGINPAAQE